MKCPQCGVAISKGQNFCGDCGQHLNSICSNCSNSNPPSYKFCGKCGRKLSDVGMLLLDRSGLILEADDAAFDILISNSGTAVGKPFSLFVSTGDLALFFSHWNEVLSSFHSQILEIELSNIRDGTIHVQLVLTGSSDQDSKSDLIRMEINDVTVKRHRQEELQEKEALLDYIQFLNDTFAPPMTGGKRRNITEVLAKLGNVAASQYLFVARIDEKSKRMFTEFNWYAKSSETVNNGGTAISLDYVRPILDKLHSGRSYVTGDIRSLTFPERQVWQIWHQQFSGAILCEMLYYRKKTVGIIGIAKEKTVSWPHSIIMLLKLAGNLMTETLSEVPVEISIARLSPLSVKPKKTAGSGEEITDINVYDNVELIINEDEENINSAQVNQQLKIEASVDDAPDGSIPVFPSDYGEYRIDCPKCHRHENISIELFEKFGWILKVTCPCEHSFRVIREMRHTYRKKVQLDGLFAQDINNVNKLAVKRGWSAIEVTNISKNGLNFTSPQARMLQIGDLVQVKFNLDNSTKSLIEKSAEIKSIIHNNIGCNFQGSGKQDVTLGFYFL